MQDQLSRRDITVLVRAVAAVLLVWNLPRVFEAWTAWGQVSRARVQFASGVTSSKQVADAWNGLVESAWPPVAGVVLLLGAGVVARMVMVGLPGPGGCRSCGYDLTGVKSGKCPECGEGVGRA
jgi:hypothetical protein